MVRLYIYFLETMLTFGWVINKLAETVKKHPPKMKYFQIIALLILVSCGTKQSNNILPTFKVTYITGCNAITKSKINVYYKDNKYFAEHTSPSYFDGKKIDSVWKIELNEKQVNACIKFLDKAKSLPRCCENISSAENHHIIVFSNNDTLDIDGPCKWDNLGFKYLDRELFGTKHIAVETRKRIFLKHLNRELTGKWYLKPVERTVKRAEIISFSKNKLSDQYLEFGDSNSITGNCRQLLNINNLKRYDIEISDGWNETVVTLNWGKITDKTEYKTWYEYGATFTLESIGNDELKLNFLWTSD